MQTGHAGWPEVPFVIAGDCHGNAFHISRVESTCRRPSTGHLGFFGHAKNVDGRNVSEYVFSIAEVIGGIEHARKMPVGVVVKSLHDSQQLLRALDSVVFQVHDRSERVYQLRAPLKNVDLHTLDVDLEELTRRQIETVERDQRNAFSKRGALQREPAEVVSHGGVERRNGNGAGVLPDGRLTCEHVRATVERQIRTQRLKHDSLRFKGMNLSVLFRRGGPARPCGRRCSLPLRPPRLPDGRSRANTACSPTENSPYFCSDPPI